MAGRVKVQPVSRAGLPALVAMAEQLRASLPGWEGSAPAEPRPRTEGDLALDLRHLATHDGDGFLTASVGDEVVGFATSYVRSRQLNVSQPWLLPEYGEHEVAEQLVRRSLAYGERAGANDAAAHVLGDAAWQTLFLRFGLHHRFPIYRLALPPGRAIEVGRELARLRPAAEVRDDALKRRAGSADLERIDRLARGVARPTDHEHWLSERRLRLAKVRDGQRLAGYAYGGPGQCGPVAAATPETALAALGWALQFASGEEDVHVLIPATFETALDHLLGAGARSLSVSHWMSRLPGSRLDRFVLPSATIS